MKWYIKSGKMYLGQHVLNGWLWRVLKSDATAFYSADSARLALLLLKSYWKADDMPWQASLVKVGR